MGSYCLLDWAGTLGLFGAGQVSICNLGDFNVRADIGWPSARWRQTKDGKEHKLSRRDQLTDK